MLNDAKFVFGMRRWQLFLLCVALSGMPGCTAISDVDQPAVSSDSQPQNIAPAVTLQVVDEAGYKEVLGRHMGKVVLVDFWATWCRPCVEQFRHTVQLDKDFRGQGLAVVSVSLDQPSDLPDVRAFLESEDATFDNLLSKYGSGTESVEVFDIPGGALPHYKLYDRRGKLRHTFSLEPTAERQFSPEDIRQQVEQLLMENVTSSTSERRSEMGTSFQAPAA
jgi:thiol-disulfide isomerase/thioredoxin